MSAPEVFRFRATRDNRRFLLRAHRAWLRSGLDAAESLRSWVSRLSAIDVAIIRDDDEARRELLALVEMIQARYGGAGGYAKELAHAAASPLSTAYSAVTGDKNVAVENLKATQGAREVLSNEELKQLVAINREQLAVLRSQGGGGARPTNSGAHGAGRSDSIINR